MGEKNEERMTVAERKKNYIVIQVKKEKSNMLLYHGVTPVNSCFEMSGYY